MLAHNRIKFLPYYDIAFTAFIIVHFERVHIDRFANWFCDRTVQLFPI